MSADDQELFRKLCEQASHERDPEKLLGLAEEICRLLDSRRLHRKSDPPPEPSSESQTPPER